MNEQAKLRDNLLVTIGSRAAYMDVMGHITLPFGASGEDELALFAAELAERYMQTDTGIGFDEYIESALQENFPKEQTRFVASSKGKKQGKIKGDAR